MGNEKKQTAAEWQIYQISLRTIALNNNKISNDYYKVRCMEIIDESIKMSKRQLELAYIAGHNAYLDYCAQDMKTDDPFEFATRAQGTYKTFEQYYEQTYGTTN